jgi:hypothetical protein
LAWGVQKPHTIFLQKAKSPCQKLSPKTIKPPMSVFPRILVSSRFRVFRSDGSSKALQKTFLQKNRAEKFSQKIDKNPQLIFVRSFLITFMGVSR